MFITTDRAGMVAKSEAQATGALPPADVDPLTGVVARQAFLKRVESRLQSETTPRFALLLVGIDDFPAVRRALDAFLARPAVAKGLTIPPASSD